MRYGTISIAGHAGAATDKRDTEILTMAYPIKKESDFHNQDSLKANRESPDAK
ncbi:MAG: hypothetical protein MI802_28580 [Desulfobacterales bacterium]|nr:hypothetical protein [Desulfobacterales bacterium]